MEKFQYTIESTNEKDNKTIRISYPDGKSFYLHSKICPANESKNYESLFNDNQSDILIILGAGLGYLFPSKISNTAITQIIIIDCIPFTSQEIEDYSKIKTIPLSINTALIHGSDIKSIIEKISDIINISEKSKITFIEHTPSVRAFTLFYKSIKKEIENIIQKKAGNLSTISKFDRLFIRNCLKKIMSLDTYKPLSALKNIFNGYPCIIISSAPSVDDFIEVIKTNQEKYLVLCVDSAVPVALKNRIMPDIIISCDPQPWTNEHLLKADRSIPIISSLSSWDCEKEFCNKFLYFNTHPFSQVLNHAINENSGADSKTGTIAGDAVSAAIFMGCSTIFIAGTDFSFPDHLIYSKDSEYNRRYTSMLNSRFSTCETLHLNYIRKMPRLFNNTATRASFLQYHDLLDKLLASNTSIPFYHLCSKGIPLKNAELLSSAEKALDTFKKLSTGINKKLLITKRHSSFEKSSKDIIAILKKPVLLTEILSNSSSKKFADTYYTKVQNFLGKAL